MFLRSAPNGLGITELQAAVTDPEILHVEGRHACVVYPAGIGRSRLTAALIEKELETRGTGRNWNTVLKLAALARALTRRRQRRT